MKFLFFDSYTEKPMAIKICAYQHQSVNNFKHLYRYKKNNPDLGVKYALYAHAKHYAHNP